MVFKGVVFCVVACLVQQSIAGPYYRPKSSCGCGSGKVSITKIEEIEEIAYRPSYSSDCVSIDIANNGGAFAVTSIGPIAPSGIAVATDLALGGDLVLSGELPYLSAVAFEGQFATGGEVPVAYGCGDIVAITEQIGGNGGIRAGSYGPSYGSYSKLGCGCKY